MRRLPLVLLATLLLFVASRTGRAAESERALPLRPTTAAAAAVDDIDFGPTTGGERDKQAFRRARDEQIALKRGLHDPEAVRARSAAVQSLGRPRRGLEMSSVGPVWQQFGPAHIDAGATIGGLDLPVSGRGTCIAIDPTDADIAYYGTETGGLFRTLDRGASWTPLTDHLLSLDIGAVAIDPQNPGTVFVGTGSNKMPGVGLYRIRNANGAAPIIEGPFNLRVTGTGTSADSAFALLGGSISCIAVDPENSNRLFLGTWETGTGFGSKKNYRGVNGLLFCENALDATPVFSVVQRFSRNSNAVVSDIKFDPRNGDVMLFTWWVSGQPDSSGVFRTANAKSASIASNVSPIFTRVQSAEFARLAVAGTGPAMKVYMVNTSPSEFRVSRDAGLTFTAMADASVNILGTAFQYPYYQVAVHPRDTTRVHAAGQATGLGAGMTYMRSTNNGAFVVSSAGLHVDPQDLEVAPSDSSVLYHIDDGGVFVSSNFGATWTSGNLNGLHTFQYNSIAASPTDPEGFLAGTQDNGTQWHGSAVSWRLRVGYDGGAAVFDQSTPPESLKMAHNVYNSSIAVHTGPPIVQTNFVLDNVGNFYMPVVNGPGNPNSLYGGTKALYRAGHFGGAFARVSQVFTENISAIAIAPTSDNVRLIGRNDGRVFGTLTGDATLTDMTGSWPLKYVGRIAIHPTNANIAYVALAGYGLAGGQHVWKTTNLLSGSPSWSSSGNGLPDVPCNAMAIDPLIPSHLYVGTDIGIFRSIDGGGTWHPFSEGLPIVPVFDITVHSAFRMLRCATYGRGLWERPLPATEQVTVTASAGSGQLGPAIPFATAPLALRAASGDLNGDGLPDVVVTTGVDSVSVLLNDGAGGFLPARNRSIGSGALSGLAIVDHNRDGRADVLACGGGTGASVALLYGDGAGGLSAPLTIPTGSAPSSIVTGNLLTTGLPDIVALTFGGAIVLRNAGSEYFPTRPPIFAATGLLPIAVAIGDLDLDGFPDIVTADYLGQTVSVLHGDTTSTFAHRTPWALGGAPASIALGDLNQDGFLDAVTTLLDPSSVVVLPGNGTGGFGSSIVLPAATSPGPVVMADMNGDDRLDVVVGCAGGVVSTFLNDGVGNLQPRTDTASIPGASASGMVVADFDGDGVRDVLVTQPDSGRVLLRRGIGGILTPPGVTAHLVGSTPTYRPLPSPGYAHSDLWLDGVSQGPAPYTFTPLASYAPGHRISAQFAPGLPLAVTAGSGEFAAQVAEPTGVGPTGVALADVDRDGRLDAIVSEQHEHAVSVRLGLPNGGFGPLTRYPAGSQPLAVTTGDLNHDGVTDLVTANGPADSVTVLLGRRGGGFAPPVGYPSSGGPVDVAIGDLDGDEHPDLAVANPDASSVSILRGDGSGRFQAIASLTPCPGVRSVAIGDLDGDGLPDLVTANALANTITVLRDTVVAGLRTFAAPRHYATPAGPTSVALADLTGDGFMEAVVACYDAAVVAAFEGAPGAAFGDVDTTAAVANGPLSVAIDDLDGDGRLDFATANHISNAVSVYFGDGQGGVTSRRDYAGGASPLGIAIGDVDLDGVGDLLVPNGESNTMTTLLGTGGIVSIPGTRWWLPGSQVTIAAAANSGYTATLRYDGALTNTGSLFTTPPLAGPHRLSVAFRSVTDVDGGALAFVHPTVYPNPSLGRPTLGLSMRSPGRLHVEVYDVTGRLVRTVARRANAEAGNYRLPLAGEGESRLEAGLYFYRAQVDGRSTNGKFVVMR